MPAAADGALSAGRQWSVRQDMTRAIGAFAATSLVCRRFLERPTQFEEAISAFDVEPTLATTVPHPSRDQGDNRTYNSGCLKSSLRSDRVARFGSRSR